MMLVSRALVQHELHVFDRPDGKRPTAADIWNCAYPSYRKGDPGGVIQEG